MKVTKLVKSLNKYPNLINLLPDKCFKYINKNAFFDITSNSPIYVIYKISNLERKLSINKHTQGNLLFGNVYSLYEGERIVCYLFEFPSMCNVRITNDYVAVNMLNEIDYNNPIQNVEPTVMNNRFSVYSNKKNTMCVVTNEKTYVKVRGKV